MILNVKFVFLFQVWSLAELATSKALASGLDPDRGAPWAYHPFGRRLLKSLYVTLRSYFILFENKVNATIFRLKITFILKMLFLLC